MLKKRRHLLNKSKQKTYFLLDNVKNRKSSKEINHLFDLFVRDKFC